jgi:hypothetical protein
MTKILNLIHRIPKFNREGTAFIFGLIFGSLCASAYWLYVASLWFIS